MVLNCKHCGHTETILTKQFFKNNSEHIRIDCAKCLRFVGYKAKATDLERAMKFKMPYGKYKDILLPQILARDPDYMYWLANECKTDKIRELAALVLTDTATR